MRHRRSPGAGKIRQAAALGGQSGSVFALGITELDLELTNLLFERFLSVSATNHRIDVISETRAPAEEVIQYVFIATDVSAALTAWLHLPRYASRRGAM